MSRQILVPIDDSPQAMAAVGHAVSFHPDADVVLMHVIEYTEKKTSLKRGGRGRDEGWYAAEREAADELFEAGRDVAAEHGAEVSTAIEDGDPATEILSYADEHDVDAIVMGSRKRSPAGKALFGSTLQKVLLRADHPVVSVPKTAN